MLMEERKQFFTTMSGPIPIVFWEFYDIVETNKVCDYILWSVLLTWFYIVQVVNTSFITHKYEVLCFYFPFG